MDFLKRVYSFIIKLFSIKVALFVFACWALNEALISEYTWFGCALLLIGGREIAKILAGKLPIGK